MSDSLRTMKGDIDELTKKEPEQLIGSVAAGLQERYERGYTPPHRETSAWKIIIAVFTMFIVSGAMAGGYYWYSQSSNKPPPKPPFELPRSIVPSTKTDEFRLKINDRTGIIDELRRRQQAYGSASFTYTPYVITSFNENPRLGTPREFLKTLRAEPPEDLFEGITDQWNIFSTNGNTVLVFTIKNETKALGGMLRWERKITSDLIPLAEEPSVTSLQDFEDILIKNNASRVRKLSNTHAIGYVIMEQHLIIATSEPALRETIDRFIAGPIIH